MVVGLLLEGRPLWYKRAWGDPRLAKRCEGILDQGEDAGTPGLYFGKAGLLSIRRSAESLKLHSYVHGIKYPSPPTRVHEYAS